MSKDIRGTSGKVTKRGRPLGSKNKTTAKKTAAGSTQTPTQRLHQIVQGIPVSEARQRQLDEEEDDTSSDEIDLGEEGGSEGESVPASTSSTPTQGDAPTSAPTPPPGEPIPIFTVQSWNAPWRRLFFTDWRWAPKKPPKKGYYVWARCKTGQCDNKRVHHYYAGDKYSFTNFVKHLNAVHTAEYEKFLKGQSKQKDPNQHTLQDFPQFRNSSMTKQRQHQLDIDLAFTLAVDNIPFHILCRPRFRHWIHVIYNY